MATKGGGVYVRSLFKLLAFVGLSQVEVARQLGVDDAGVNFWATGRRPMPQRHLEAFETFVWEALRQKNDAYVRAIYDELYPGWSPGTPIENPILFKPLDPEGPDPPPVVQRLYAFHQHVTALLREWDVELHQERHVERAKALIRQLGKVAVAEGDKLDAMLEGPDRRQLLDSVAELHELLQGLERIDARPIAARLRQALTPWPGAPLRQEGV